MNDQAQKLVKQPSSATIAAQATARFDVELALRDVPLLGQDRVAGRRADLQLAESRLASRVEQARMQPRYVFTVVPKPGSLRKVARPKSRIFTSGG